MDTQGEFLLSSLAKAMTTGEEQTGDITGVTSKKTKQWQKARFLIIPFKMLLPSEFVWYEFFLISISIRNEKFVTKDICSVNAKLPAFQ